MNLLLLVMALAFVGAAGATPSNHGVATASIRVLAFNVQFDSTRTAESLVAPPKYPHRAFFPKSGTWGLGIASRWPVSAAHTFPASPSRMPALEATVHTPAGPLHVVCVHLFPPAAKRRKHSGFFASLEQNAALRVAQSKRLLKRYRRVTPLIVLGDFNETSDGDAVKTLLAARFVDACSVKDADCRATWPGPNSPWPAVARIDLVLGRGVGFISARVPDGGGSDHRPMTAALVIRNP
jgi:endonuclease/exonuclease/phosphatase family metal-dependent hydrolase